MWKGLFKLRFFCLAVLFAVMCLRVVAYATADGANPGYLGTWTLTGATAAPWAPLLQRMDAAQRSTLLGQTVVLTPGLIAGPPPFNCGEPHYKFRDLTAAEIFSGVLGRMAANDRSTDPELIAGNLGFLGPSVKTLETGCRFTFHFVDAATAEVGVDDTIFTLKKR